MAKEKFFTIGRWADGLRIAGGAIGVTIIGDLTLQTLTGEISEWSQPGRWWRMFLYLAAILGVIYLWPAIVRLADRFRSRSDLNLGSERSVQATEALIVTASAPENPDTGPHWTATENFLKAEGSGFKHLYIIHSSDDRCLKSVRHLEHYANTRGVTSRSQGFQANYDDLSDVYQKARLAIELAVAEVGDPSEVTVDITGGTKLSSVGISMAMVEREDDIVLGHIPWEWNEELGRTIPGTKMRVVDLTWNRT